MVSLWDLTELLDNKRQLLRMSVIEAERAIYHGNFEWAERLKPGQTFQSWDELKGYIVEHGVQTERIIRTYKKNPKRWLDVCKMNWATVDEDKRCKHILQRDPVLWPSMQHPATDLKKPGMVFISDREKGLLDGVEDYFPQGFHAFCAWHLGDNCRTKFNKKAQKAFEPLVYATTPDQFKRRLERIKAANKKWAEYIEKIANPKHCSRAYCPVRRWGHETSQHAESLNRALKPQRQEAAFKQSNLLWDYGMTKFYKKKTLAESVTTPFQPNIMTILRHIEEKAMQLIADPSSNTECRVADHLGRQFWVEFEPEWKCTCGDFQDKLYPCVHAWRACTRLRKRHFDFVSPYYNTTTFKKTYEISVPAIMYDNLVPNMQCGFHVKRRRRGRPSEKLRMRFSEEDPVRGPRKCAKCKEIGHDRRTCPVLEAMNGQSKGMGPNLDSDHSASDNDEAKSLIPMDNPSELPSDQLSDDGDSGDSIDAWTSESSSDEEVDHNFTLDAIAAQKDLYHSDDELSQDEQTLLETQQMEEPLPILGSSNVLDLSTSQSVRDLFDSQVCTQGTVSSQVDSIGNSLRHESMSCTDLLASVMKDK